MDKTSGECFVVLKYTEITQNTYIQSWTVTEIMAIEEGGFSGESTHCTCQLTFLSMSTLQCGVRCHIQAIHLTLTLNCIPFRVITQCTPQLRCEWLVGKLYGVAKRPFFVFPRGILWHAFCVWILRWQCTCCCWRIPKAFSRSKDSVSKCIYSYSPDIAWHWLSSKCFCALRKGGGRND